MDLVRIERDGAVLRVTLDRPESRNALSPELVAEIGVAFQTHAGDPTVRAAVLAGAGPDFCAGADLAYMKRLGSASFEDNLADAEHLSAAFRALHEFPRPVIARVQGNVFGGGAGLVAACDIAIAAKDARFAFSEVRLGILPAVISPYVLRRIGEGSARRLFLTGERFDGPRAVEIGLASQAVDAADLDRAVTAVLGEILMGSPDAQHRIKRLLDTISDLPLPLARERAPRFIAEARASEQGQEGLSAFLERRRPSWSESD